MNKRRNRLIGLGTLAILLLASLSFGQNLPVAGNQTDRIQPHTIPLPTGRLVGTVYTTTNAASATDCTAGGGSTVHMCLWNGAAWVTASGSGGGVGTVTSVGLAGTPSQVTVTGASPITGSGSWTLSLPSTINVNAQTATALAAAGTDCGPNQYQYGSDASGNALCTTLPTQTGSQYIAPQPVTGCGVEWTGLLTFTVGACTYTIGGVTQTSAVTALTLTAANGSNPRIELIYIDGATNTVTFDAGTPAPSPAVPTEDPSTTLELTSVYVDTSATVPTNATKYDIYHSDSADWTATTGGTNSARVNTNSTSNPYTGDPVEVLHDIEFGTSGVVNSTTYAQLAYSSAVDISTVNNLVFYIRNKALWVATRSITIQWLSTGTAKGQAVVLSNGAFGFNATTNFTTYQQISIPTSIFGIAGVAVNDLRFTVSGTGTALTGFYIDDVTLQGGNTGLPLPATLMNFKGTWNSTASYQANDTVVSAGIGYVALVPNVNVAVTTTATWAAVGKAGTVTSVAVSSPLGGGPITGSGTLTCATCAIGPGTSTANHLAKFSGVDGLTLADGGIIPAGNLTATTPTANGVMTGAGTQALNVTAAGKTGQVFTSTNAAQPAFASPGIGKGNGGADVTGASYLLKCDSSTAILDRGTEVVFASGASTPVVPDPTDTGCGASYAVKVLDKNAGSLVFGRETSATTFDVYGGASTLLAQTSFTLTNSQSAVVAADSTTHYIVTVTGGASGLSSVGLTTPTDILTTTGSPLTSNGTLAVTKAIQSPNTFWRGGTSASTGNIVQSNTGFANAPSTLTVSFNNPNTAGDLLIVASAADAYSQTISSTNEGSSWTALPQQVAGFSLMVWYTCNAVGGANSVTVSGLGGNATAIAIAEISGNPTSACLDLSVKDGGYPRSTLSVTTAGTAGQATEQVIAFGSTANGFYSGGFLASPPPLSPGPGYLLVNSALDMSDNPGLYLPVYTLSTNTGLSGTQTAAITWNPASTGHLDNTQSGLSLYLLTFKLNTSNSSIPPVFGPLVAADMPAHTPIAAFVSTSTAQTTALTASSMTTVGSVAALYEFKGEINCTTSNATATAILTVGYTDTSNTAQTPSVTAACTTLGTLSVGNLDLLIRAKTNTTITYGVAVANSPTYDVDVRLEQLP